MAYSGNAGVPLFGEGSAGTLKLMAYLVLAVGLMVADHRGQYLGTLRAWGGLVAEPLYWLASSPARIARELHDTLSTRAHLSDERDRLSEELLVARAQLHRLEAVQRENESLRRLLLGKRGLTLNAQLADIADIELDPFRHRVRLDIGSRHGVVEGLAVIDADGVVGQITEVGPLHSTVLMITDPAHAVPVQVQRSGLRTIAFGSGDHGRVTIPNIAQNADIREGDTLLTSGIGGRFPAGLPVAVVTRLQPEATHLFIEADARPLAALDRSGQVLLVTNSPPVVPAPIGPPGEPAAADAATAAPAADEATR